MGKFKRVSIYVIFVLPALAVYLAVIAFPIISSYNTVSTELIVRESSRNIRE